MDPDVTRVAQILMVVGSFAALAVSFLVVVKIVLERTRVKPTDSGQRAPRLDEDRFARLEQAVDSIALEVERIAEAQRFSAKLMSERLPERQPERLRESGRE
jgi:hypothetical protein